MDTAENSGTQAPQTGAPGAAGVDPDLQIDHLAYEEARKYVLGFLVGEKKTKAALLQKEQDLNKWNERLAFAEKKGLPQQLEEARRQLHYLIQEKAALKAELEALERKNIILKEKLQAKSQTAGIPSSVFAEQLLANLEDLADVGEYKWNEALKQQAAEDELAKMKAKLGLG